MRRVYEILGIPEKTKAGDRPGCQNCAQDCKNKKSGWICGNYKDGSDAPGQIEWRL